MFAMIMVAVLCTCVLRILLPIFRLHSCGIMVLCWCS